MPPTKTRDAVFLNGEPLGVLHFKKDKDALRQFGLLKSGQLTPAPSTLQSNFSHTYAKIDPTTIEYPQEWTKESIAFGVKQSPDTQQQFMVEQAAPILQKIKDRPTFLFTNPSDKTLGLIGMAVDNHKVETVSKWLTNHNVEFSQVPPEDVIRETKKGLAVFNLVTTSIPPKTWENMTKKFGVVIESASEYQQLVNSLAARPQFLKAPDQLALNPHRQSTQTTPQTTRQSTPKPTPPSLKTINSQVPTILPKEVKTEPDGVVNRTVIDDLRDWYAAADKLGKPSSYKKRIVEVAERFKSTQQLSSKALFAMNQDTEQYRILSRLTQIAGRISPILGESTSDGSFQVKGKIYDIFLNPERKDLIISQKNGDVVLSVQSGKVQTNKVSPDIIQTFEQANAKVDQLLSPVRSGGMEL
ncbi:hypothetical protein FNW02_31205 [Komarekiella sp. 'clone 1']|uniref:Uncharacterized protein n=1 Tax=Komarekiella delphini-convector SJRDD-AB1 TaxID=2593771 RepID=A0AA40T399_9NOST|nr:hypothetical protein [Komarekiella delphini-convector]MBD6620141.1 hypothetical protein [Komarekiella delphini-convector SJRDD-AB1]